MYEPKKIHINDKANELMQDWLNDDDGLGDALVMNIPAVKALLNANHDDIADRLLDLKQALESFAKTQRDFEADARDFLVGQVGYTKRTDVDDYKFVVHG